MLMRVLLLELCGHSDSLLRSANSWANRFCHLIPEPLCTALGYLLKATHTHVSPHAPPFLANSILMGRILMPYQEKRKTLLQSGLTIQCNTSLDRVQVFHVYAGIK